MGFDTVEFLAMGAGVLLLLLLCTFLILLAFAVTSFEYCCVDSRVPRLMFQTHFGPTVPEIDGILDQLINCRFRIVTRVMENGIQNKELAPSAPEFWRSVSAV
jgi:hypothetical protein